MFRNIKSHPWKAPSFAPSDFMSLAQSDIVNVDDSISQIDFAQSRAKTPTMPKVLLDLNSEVSQSTEKLLAIRPQSIMMGDEQSTVSLQTEHMAAEFNRVQRSMDVNFGMAPRSTVSSSQGWAFITEKSITYHWYENFRNFSYHRITDKIDLGISRIFVSAIKQKC